MPADRDQLQDDRDLLGERPVPGPENGEPTGRRRDDHDMDDGETVGEDSGAGSFLDRFVPPRAPDAS